ncbi:MAG: hypothetical protein MJ076_00820 [Clostridia bacterium]|nr:hypothetical protein [Clostridia bacterium]
MKKIIAIALALVLALSLSTVAFALDPIVSPSNPESSINITVITKPGTRGKVNVQKIGDQIKLTADESVGKFDSWSFYTTDGSVAVLDQDYKIVSGSANEINIVIKGNKDIIACANYDGKITDPLTAEQKESKSAKTNDALTMSLCIIALMSLAIAFGTKKQLSK